MKKSSESQRGHKSRIKQRVEKAKRRRLLAGIIVLSFIAGSVAGIGLYIAGQWLPSSPEGIPQGVGPLGSQHIHADFKLYVRGKAWDFSQPKYQLRSKYVHFEDGDGNVIHVHATGVTMGFFFQTLGMKFNATCLVLDTGESLCNQPGTILLTSCPCGPDARLAVRSAGETLKFYVNGMRNYEHDKYVIRDLDKILVSYGSEGEEEVKKQLASITDLAKYKSGKAKEPGLGVAPDFTLRGLDGRTFTLRDFKGKVVVLWFMATWCPTCIQQAETLKRIKADFGDRVVIIAIDLWVPAVIGGPQAQGLRAETEEDLKRFKELVGGDWIWALDTDRVTLRYGVTSVDYTVVISPDGTIVFRYAGPTGYERLAEAIKRVLSG